MKGEYLKYILFEGKNIEIQWVLTIHKILLPLVLKISANFWNLANFFGL